MDVGGRALGLGKDEEMMQRLPGEGQIGLVSAAAIVN